MRNRNISVEFSGAFCFAAALYVLLLPMPWLLAGLMAAIFHELCHYGMIRLCGGQVSELRIGAGGAVMETDLLSSGKECLCALAGPVGGVLLVLAGRWIPRIAVCAAAQTVFNLLPLFPLDGGRAIRSLLKIFIPERCALIICHIAELSCIFFVMIMSLRVFLDRWGIWYPMLVVLLLLVRFGKIKIPCKPAR